MAQAWYFLISPPWLKLCTCCNSSCEQLPGSIPYNGSTGYVCTGPHVSQRGHRCTWYAFLSPWQLMSQWYLWPFLVTYSWTVLDLLPLCLKLGPTPTEPLSPAPVELPAAATLESDDPAGARPGRAEEAPPSSTRSRSGTRRGFSSDQLPSSTNSANSFSSSRRGSRNARRRRGTSRAPRWRGTSRARHWRGTSCARRRHSSSIFSSPW